MLSHLTATVPADITVTPSTSFFGYSGIQTLIGGFLGLVTLISVVFIVIGVIKAAGQKKMGMGMDLSGIIWGVVLAVVSGGAAVAIVNWGTTLSSTFKG